MRRYARTLIIIAVLVVVSFAVLGIQSFNIGNFERGDDTLLGLKLGLDLQGGSHLVYQAASEELPSSDEMESLRKILERRANSSGLGEPIIQILGEDRLLVQLPGVSDTGRAKRIMGETAQLEFLHRSFNVPRDIGIVSDEIVSARITTVIEERERLISEASATSVDGGPATTTAPTAATSTSAASTPATSTDVGMSTTTATTTPTATLPPILINQLVTTTPLAVVTFTPDAADRFEEVVDRLAKSLALLPGTDNPIYPDLLTISPVADAQTQIQVPYTTFAQTTLGIIPVGGSPLIERVGLSATYYIILPQGSFLRGTVDDFVEEFGAEPDIVLGEIAGKVDEDIELTGDDLARAYAGQHQGSGAPIVNIEFNSEGTRKFGEVTTRIAGTNDLLAIVLDEQELIAPTVESPITGGAAFIQGRGFTLERVREIALLLEAGRLPLPIELIQERNVDAILGADSLAKSVVAGVIGLALVLLFMALYYRVPGLVAAAALIFYASFVLAIFKLLPVTLTLSGVAAAILSIGMAVDANILIFERMKDELRQGRTLLSSINLGFNRAWPAIRDGNVSTLITCGILFWFADTLGATIVQGFAITLAIGVGVSMFSAITVSRTLLRLMAATRLNTKPGWFVPVRGSELPQIRSRGETA